MILLLPTMIYRFSQNLVAKTQPCDAPTPLAVPCLVLMQPGGLTLSRPHRFLPVSPRCVVGMEGSPGCEPRLCAGLNAGPRCIPQVT